jgi:NADH dehydrogenase FAD-containing subunit
MHVQFICAKCVDIDMQLRHVVLHTGDYVPFDILLINVGSTSYVCMEEYHCCFGVHATKACFSFRLIYKAKHWARC